MKNILHKCAGLFSVVFILSLVFVSCMDNELPDTNSIADNTPPKAAFSYSQSDATDFRVVTFSNESASSTTYSWTFEGAGTSTDQDPTVTFPGEGEYTVELTASDARGESDFTTLQVSVVEGPFQPVILEPGFESESLPDGTGDGRDSWRNSTLGGVIQITGDPVTFGVSGAKLPQDGDRIGYQEIVVEAETNYDLRFWYTMKNVFISDPSLTVAILGVTESGPFESRDEANAGTIASITVNDTEEPSTYEEEQLTFNSGANTTVAIYFYNSGVETRLDDFTIEVGKAGAVAPSVGFDIFQSADNYLEYSFVNTSKNGETYMWDFGDGNTSPDESPTHVYDVHNIYPVTLTVTSAEGLSSTLTKNIDIQASVTADFTKEIDADDFATVHFMDASTDAVMLLWEFGDGFQFTGMNPSHTYDAEGIYTVTLTAYSVTGVTDVMKMDVIIAMGFIAIDPEVINGDFTEGTSGWKIGSFTGGNTNAFNSSSDGSPIDYDGVDTGAKTKGAKWTMSTSAGEHFSSDTRYAYQALTVSPNETYIVEWEHAIKNDAADAMGGDRVIVGILDGHYDDGADALNATVLVESVGAEALGKGNFTKLTQEFESNDSGLIALWIYGITNEDAWADNVKVYPKI